MVIQYQNFKNTNTIPILYQYTHTIIHFHTIRLVNLRNAEPILSQYEINTLSQLVHFSPIYDFAYTVLYLSFIPFFYVLTILSVTLLCLNNSA